MSVCPNCNGTPIHPEGGVCDVCEGTGQVDDENIYVRYKDNLERVVAFMEKEGVNSTMLLAYTLAKGYEQDAAEQREEMRTENKRGECCYTDEEIRGHGVWHEYEASFDAEMDEAKDSVLALYDEIAAAMVAIYGERP